MSAPAGRRGESGYALAALLVALSVMLIGMGAAAPTWRYIMKNMREEELIFRGGQIADAIQRYQAKNGNAVPTSLEVLVKGRYLRKDYEDPFSEDGEWRLIRPGDVVQPGQPAAGAGGGRPGRPPRPRPTPRRPATRRRTMGGIVGVASRSTDEGLRLFNGRSHYNEWIFAAGQPRVIGKTLQAPGRQPQAGAQPSLRPVPGQPPKGGVPQRNRPRSQ
jgi:type II secretory pathway pseudopilin PulG